MKCKDGKIVWYNGERIKDLEQENKELKQRIADLEDYVTEVTNALEFYAGAKK